MHAMDLNTHLAIDATLCGEPVELTESFAHVKLKTTAAMAADEQRLVHGGFVFGLADYAAMLAVNHPLVVLAGAEVKFLAPSRVGDELHAHAKVRDSDGKRASVDVEVKFDEKTVFSGSFKCVVPKQHVLTPR